MVHAFTIGCLFLKIRYMSYKIIHSKKKIQKNIDLKLFHRTLFYSFIPCFYADTVKDKTNKIQKLRKNILISYVNTLCSAEEQEGRLGICQPCLDE